MAYLIFSANEQEITRRELKGSLVIGRASDCDVCVRDIMMSRAHARVALQGDRWVVTDLASRNGTFLAHERVEQHLLRDGEALRMGRTRVMFCAGKFEPGAKKEQKPARVRPVDPNESFAGTVVGFELLEPGEAEYDQTMPIPQPRPLQPVGYEDEAHDLLTEIAASSAWNGMQEKSVRVQKSAGQAQVWRGRVRTKSRVSFALQAREVRDETKTRQKNARALSAAQKRFAAVALSLGMILVGTAAFMAVEWNSPGKTVAGVTKAAVPERVVAPAVQAAAVESNEITPVNDVQWVGAEGKPAMKWDGEVVGKVLLYSLLP